MAEYKRTACRDIEIYYFGKWFHAENDTQRTDTQFNACEFAFMGTGIQWIGPKDSSSGIAAVYIDGRLESTADLYSAAPTGDTVLFEKAGLAPGCVHLLRIIALHEKNPQSSGYALAVAAFLSETPIEYVVCLRRRKEQEYGVIQSSGKSVLAKEKWRKTKRKALSPDSGVVLKSGLWHDAFEKNIRYLFHCFDNDTLCDGVGWSQWLPASNEGRMLAGAGNALRWGENAGLRRIVDTLVAKIKNRMREDGYYNYYPESESYRLNEGMNSERKNYDRVFWTRGLLAASFSNTDALGLLRRMYDWFNQSPYLPMILEGSNATNGTPGGPMMYHSPVGKDDDLLVTMRYYDQDYWMESLSHREDMCFCFYPGERPHCYDLLCIEAFIDEYRATGAEKYLNAVFGAWDVYKTHYKHIGGATAICEADGPYPPGSFYLTTGHNGETCGSVFWININQKLLELFPQREAYAAEIEESLLNVLFSAQSDNGYIRYHNRLHGKKEMAKCENTCCEVSSAGLFGRLPELIYAIADEGIYVHQYATSSLTWNGNKLDLNTDFPTDGQIKIRVDPAAGACFIIYVRIPAWVNRDVEIFINEKLYGCGKPGSYMALQSEWMKGDIIKYELPMSITVKEYTGLDQNSGLGRSALQDGPVLMAFTGFDPEAAPRLHCSPADLSGLLVPDATQKLAFTVKGYPALRVVPYNKISDEYFTCFPVVEP